MHRLKAKFALTLITLVWGSLILKDLLRMVFCFVYDKFNPKHQLIRNTLLTQDYYTMVILGGHHLTYISGMLGFFKLDGSRTGTICADFVDWLFLKFTGEPNHCISAMNNDDIYEFSAKRALAGVTLYFASLYLIIHLLKMYIF